MRATGRGQTHGGGPRTSRRAIHPDIPIMPTTPSRATGSPDPSDSTNLWRTVLVPCAFLFVSMLNLTLIVAGLKELIMDELGGSEEHVSLFFSIEMVAYVIFAPLWGLWSDRLGRRRPFIVVGFLMSAAIYASYSAVSSIPLLLAMRFVQGAFSVMGWSILMAMVLDQPDERRRGRYMGLMGASLILGVSIGAPLGGYISRSYGPYAPLEAAAGLFFVLALGSLGLAGSRDKRDQVSLREIFGSLVEKPRLLVPALFYMVDRYAVGFIVVLFPLYLETLGVSDPAQKGQLLGYFLVPFAFLQVPGGWLTERIGPWRPLLIGSLLYGLALCTIGYSDLYGLKWAMLLLGVLAAVMFPPAITLTAQLSDPQTRGSAMGGFNLAGSVGFAIGPIVGVWVYKAYGFGFAFVVAGALEVLAAITGIIVLWSWRRSATSI